MKKQVSIKYDLGHTYDFIYEKTDLFCPTCEEQEVWEEQSSGDFYVGVDYDCTNCETSFNLPCLGTNSNSNEGKQLMEQLRE